MACIHHIMRNATNASDAANGAIGSMNVQVDEIAPAIDAVQPAETLHSVRSYATEDRAFRTRVYIIPEGMTYLHITQGRDQSVRSRFLTAAFKSNEEVEFDRTRLEQILDRDYPSVTNPVSPITPHSR